MQITRRKFIVWMGAMTLLPYPHDSKANRRDDQMYGLIGKMLVKEGAREQLANILLEGVAGMPGCLSYIVANDSQDENALWITEVWESKEKHAASLSLPSVQDAIGKGRPLIKGFAERFETTPLGGQGI